MQDTYDIAIIGGGPAGMTAGLYAGRARMKTVLIEKGICGGQAILTDRIENFPGFPEGVSGPRLGELMAKQAEHFGLEVLTAYATGLKPGPAGCGPFTVELENGKTVESLAVIVSTGARWNRLGVPGENELSGRGVSYCGTCDGPLFRNREVVVVGGGDTAIEDAIFLTRFASRVTVVHRRDRLRATKILQERAASNKKIELCLKSVAVEISGREKVEAVKVRRVDTGAESVIKTSAVFVLIGLSPNTDIVKGLLGLDDQGYVITDDDMRSSIDGIFACGDVRRKTLRQVITAAGDGAAAAFSAQHYVERLTGTEYK